MLIAIAGSQGSGKTTVLQYIKDKYQDQNQDENGDDSQYGMIERKTSRSILDDWNVTLDDINNDCELTIKFQEEISKRKWDDEVLAIAGNKIWFTERTHMDLFTYALIVLGKNNKYSDWLDDYYKKCFARNQCYQRIFYLNSGCFDVEKDGVRGNNQHYSEMVDALMKMYIKQATRNNIHILTSCDTNNRVEEILHNI